MGRFRFVTPETVRCELSDGDWIEIKKQLAVGEKKKLDTAGLRRISGRQGDPQSSAVEVDWQRFALARAETYLVAWSFRNQHGNVTDPTRDLIEALDQETFDEIDAAITKHLDALDAEKKARAGGMTSPTPATSTPA